MRTHRRAVVNADPVALEEVETLVENGRVRSVSDFVREAMKEKLQRLHAASLAGELERFCAAGYAEEDIDLVQAQPIARAQEPGSTSRPRKPRRSRAAR